MGDVEKQKETQVGASLFVLYVLFIYSGVGVSFTGISSSMFTSSITVESSAVESTRRCVTHW